MKKLVHIQSFSDIITNSSSELFVMYKHDAAWISQQVKQGGGYCDLFKPLDMECIENNDVYDLWEIICDLLHVSYEEAGAEYRSYANTSWGGFWHHPDEECWKIFVDEHREQIQKEIVGKDYYLIEFEDHFADACDVNDSARDLCITERNHH